MIGLSFDGRAAFQAGGMLTMVMTLILLFKAREAHQTIPAHRTLALPAEREHRPPEQYAQWASATILRETYFTFARWTAAISVAMWVIALVCSGSRSFSACRNSA